MSGCDHHTRPFPPKCVHRARAREHTHAHTSESPTHERSFNDRCGRLMLVARSHARLVGTAFGMASRQVRRKRALSAELSVPTEAETATSESNNSPTLASKRRRRTETPSAIELPDIEELASSVCAYTSWSEWLAQPMHHHRFDREQVSALRTKLLAWYDANKRELPWRQTPVEDPLKDVNAASQRAYQVWISEIMLQQTRCVPWYCCRPLEPGSRVCGHSLTPPPPPSPRGRMAQSRHCDRLLQSMDGTISFHPRVGCSLAE